MSEPTKSAVSPATPAPAPGTAPAPVTVPTPAVVPSPEVPLPRVVATIAIPPLAEAHRNEMIQLHERLSLLSYQVVGKAGDLLREAASNVHRAFNG